jgi:hypothetical protein
MKRRTVIASAAALAGGLSGCTGLDGGAGDGGDGSPPPSTPPSPSPSPTRSPTESPTRTQPSTPTRTATPTPARAITGTSFEIVENACGTGRDEATVERGSGRVTVRGTVSGRNGCFTAELASTAYDTDAGELTVAVRSFSEAGAGEGCTQCLVDIDYRAEVTYDAPDPETVTVLHNGEPVSTTED